MRFENKEKKHFPVRAENPLCKKRVKIQAENNEKRNCQLQPDSLQTNKTACLNKTPYYNTYRTNDDE